MIVARKTDDKVIYIKLSLLGEEFILQDGFKKYNTDLCFPPIEYPTETFSKEKLDRRKTEIEGRHPRNNLSVLRIFDAICKGNWQEVNFSMQFVSFQDTYYDGKTAAVATLFCTSSCKRILMIKSLMKWKFNFKSPDFTFQRDPLHWCSILNYKEEYELILEYLNGDVDYHAQDIDGNTYLHLAVMSNGLDLVKLITNNMIMNEIRADISNCLGLTPYILSRKLGHRDISKYIQSIPIVSLNVLDTILYKSPREWSILGHNAREKINNLKGNNQKEMETFKFPEIVNKNHEESKVVDVKKIIHSAYIVWINQHVNSFRKAVRNPEPLVVRSKVLNQLPVLEKKSKI